MSNIPYHCQVRFNRRALLRGAACSAGTFGLAGRALAEDDCSISRAINPIIFQRADAQIERDEVGRYVLTATVPEYDRVAIRRSEKIAGLSTAEERVVWRRPEKGQMGGYIWAPEIHRLNGKWYIWFGAGDKDEVFHIRIYVLACDSDDPIAGNWSVVGQLETPWDTFTLDATQFTHRGVSYLCWAQQEPGIETNSNLYLAPLDTPTTLAAKPVRLTVPTLEWEIQGFKVNEGPALLKHGDGLFLTYSASATDANYCIGMLSAREDAEIMDPASWTKSLEPVFTTTPKHCIFGPGHNSFTTDECGRDLLVYHARNYERTDGDPLYDPNRHTRVQHFSYDERGRPVFGAPVPNGPLVFTEG